MESHVNSLAYAPAPPHRGRAAGPHAGAGVVRLIGLYKLLKAAAMVTLGVTALRMVHHDLNAVVADWVEHLHLDPGNRFLVHRVYPGVAHMTDARLRLLGCGAFVYAVLYTVQGVGLLAARCWAEWLTVVSGVLLVPVEIYELCRHATWAKAAILVSNVVIAAYLYYHVRRRAAAAAAADAVPSDLA